MSGPVFNSKSTTFQVVCQLGRIRSSNGENFAVQLNLYLKIDTLIKMDNIQICPFKMSL